jgi:hypothetical protein
MCSKFNRARTDPENPMRLQCFRPRRVFLVNILFSTLETALQTTAARIDDEKCRDSRTRHNPESYAIRFIERSPVVRGTLSNLGGRSSERAITARRRRVSRRTGQQEVWYSMRAGCLARPIGMYCVRCSSHGRQYDRKLGCWTKARCKFISSCICVVYIVSCSRLLRRRRKILRLRQFIPSV